MLPANKVALSVAQKNQVRMDAYNLSVDTTTHDVACPCCRQRKSFSVTRQDAGLLYKCFRASCGVSGFIPTAAASLYNEQKLVPVKINPYKDNISSPTAGVYAFLFKMYGITKKEAMRQGWMYDRVCHRLLMPVNNLYGYKAGMLAKKLPGSSYGGPKVVNYWEVPDRIRMHFPIGAVKGKRVIVVVEDILSATRVGKYAPSCALLGTSMSQTQAAFLARNFKNILLILDADAVDKARDIQRKYSALFKSFRVIVPTCDPKDMGETQLGDTIGALVA